LRSRLPIDQAVAIAKTKQLMTAHKFNCSLDVRFYARFLIEELICADGHHQLPGRSLFDEIGQPICEASLRFFKEYLNALQRQVSHRKWGTIKARE